MKDPFDAHTHEPFMMDQLLPLVVDYAHANGYPTATAAMAAFMAMATILQHKGLTRTDLMSVLDTTCANHDAPEGLQ
ncbi:hypothetical protein [Stutzerimonas kunmingensis]|uniref:hypothetical protein n=1 Tax=Stutzerimonas kunmingensis TaxID=1211807 RepID=UPI00289C97CF|nr:hypothetical protein [Stutzerimonas kunmingensis]